MQRKYKHKYIVKISHNIRGCLKPNTNNSILTFTVYPLTNSTDVNKHEH